MVPCIDMFNKPGAFFFQGNEIDKYRGEFEEFDSTSDVGTVLSPLTGQIRGAIYFDGINRFYFLTVRFGSLNLGLLYIVVK